MKATGIVRKIDNLGRAVIPKEIRETRETLTNKAQRYNRLQGISLIFVTDGAPDRVDYILDRVYIPKAGGHFDNLKKFIKEIKRAS